MRSSVAYAVSAIAHWDWPEAWPQLFTLLMDLLVSGDVSAVHGAMRVLTGKDTRIPNSKLTSLLVLRFYLLRVFTSSLWPFLKEFTREVTDTQMPLVAPVILPEM